MNKFNLFKYLFFCLLFSLCLNSQVSNNKPLNVIWISCEDMGPILSAYGNSTIKTPNIDRLANQGVKYTNAYSTVGVCAPSRFSIITGMYPARLGAHNMRTGDHNNFKWPEDVKIREDKGVLDKLGNNVPDYEVVTPDYVKPFTEYLRAEGFYCVNDNKCDYQFNAPFTAWDDVYGGGSYKNAPTGTPFFYVKNFYTTHESRIWRRKNKPMTVSPVDVPIPDYYPDLPVVREGIARKYSNIEAFDKEVGELLNQFEVDGVLDNSIIFFWSDHGGNLLRQKRAVGNSGLHVPLIVRYPDGFRAGETDNRMVSLMDLGPTVMSLMGIKPPTYMDGKAFAGKFEDNPRTYIFGSADRFDESTDMQRSVLDGRYVYIKNFMPHLPLIYRNKYREQIPMNKQLIELNTKGVLEGDAAYIFMQNKPFEELTKDDFYSVFDINVFSVAYLIQKLLPFFNIDSHVVNISSIGGVIGSSKFPGLAAYSASKGALNILTEVLAEEYKESGPKFNSLSLGSVNTPMLKKAFPGYEAQVNPNEMASYIYNFANTGSKLFNGKVIPVSSSTP